MMRSVRALPSLLLIVGMSGCPVVGGSGACVSWAGYETPQDQYDQAELVVVGQVIDRVDLIEEADSSPYGDTRIYSFDVEQTLKGEAPGDEMRIGSTSDGCPDTHYADGDQLDTGERIIVFATEGDSGWQTLSPFQGVLRLPDGSDLPVDIPSAD